ncbi:hypothetical protein DOS84_01315 [Flavobacterium aquariorum]|uniref:Uncharacterized protein n=1 Tax=Flavobacterium aquariorum TaxID=2217670 RepID=A0A2W7TY30_9FLAO|nr:hypothetical protein DOS84_01315 [Flavobacterium aquariorum]
MEGWFVEIVYLTKKILGKRMPREGQKQATEVARMARLHKEKGPNHRYSELVPFLYGGTPKK